MRYINLLLSIVCALSAIYSQEQLSIDTSDIWDNSQSEKLFETNIGNDENSTAAEEINQLEENPIDINTASLEELQRIPFFTSIIAYRIVEKRKTILFDSLNDLLTIQGIEPKIFLFVKKYLKIGKQKDDIKAKGSYLSRLSGEVEERKGFENGDYPGSKYKVFNRFRLSLSGDKLPLSNIFQEIYLGFLTEKDPGERSMANHAAGYVGVSMPCISSRFLVGDYQIEAAEGLIFWRASAFSKGSDVIAPVRKNGSGIRPYLSSDENRYLRGMALSVNIDFAKVQLFYSHKFINAALDSLGSISSIDRSGLFRTEGEIIKNNSAEEILYGGRMELFPIDGLKIGGTGYYSKLSKPMVLKAEGEKKESNLWMGGIDVSYTTEVLDIFSECALDRTDALAIVYGIIYEPIKTFSMAVAARKFPKTFHSIHGNVFGESGEQVQNENGMYVGLRFQLLNEVWISTYFDQFKHPAITQLITASSNGNDFLALAEIKISRRFEMSFRFKQKKTASDFNDNDLYGRSIDVVVPRFQKNYRFSTEFASSSSIRLTSRVEWVSVNYDGINPSEKGLLLSQSVKLTICRSLLMKAKLAVFYTKSYDSRIYVFEDDLPGINYNMPLYGRGIRSYLIFRYNFFSRMYIAVKYAQTVKEGVKTLGSGLDEINGNSQNTVSGQIEVRF